MALRNTVRKPRAGFASRISTTAADCDVVVYDGYVSARHAVILVESSKAKYMVLETNQATLDYCRRMKSVLDPKNILNPHKSFDFDPESAAREIPRAYG